MPHPRPLLVVTALAASLFVARPASALPIEESIFLISNQRVAEGYPQAALFGYYFAREGTSYLGIYAGPRWTFGRLGFELKTGAYGGPAADARVIFNNQTDYTHKWFSVTSFTDVYPGDSFYTYLSTYLNLQPLYLGFVGDYTHELVGVPYRKLSGGPTIGVGTKTLYFGTTYMFSSKNSNAIRLTVGFTF
jgi:hypothetical protein